jgi:hypothetical protein
VIRCKFLGDEKASVKGKVFAQQESAIILVDATYFTEINQESPLLFPIEG